MELSKLSPEFERWGFRGETASADRDKPNPGESPSGEIIARVCGTLELPVTDLMTQTRAPRVAHARSIICHLAFAGGHRRVDIARQLRLTGSAVSIACQRGKEAIARHPALLEMVEEPPISTF